MGAGRVEGGRVGGGRTFASWSRKKFFDYCRETSAHGLNHINENRTLPVKVIWSLVFVGCTCLTVAGLVDTWVKFRDCPMAIDQQIMPNTTVRYPRIDVCTRNRFDGTKIKALNVSEEMIQTLDAAYLGAFDERLFDRIQNKPHLKGELRDLVAAGSYSDFGELLIQLIPDCWDVFEYSFKGATQEWSNCALLPLSHFLWPDGSCFSLDGVTGRADNQGMQLWFKFPTAEEKYLDADNVEPYVGYTLDSMDTVVTRITPGAFFQIFFKLKTIQTVNKPPEHVCVEDEDYDIVKCRLDCAERIDEKNQVCGCQPARESTRQLFNNSHFLVMANDSTPICDPWELVACYDKRLQFRPELFDEIAIENCKKTCPHPCNTDIYSFRVIKSELDVDIVPHRYSFDEALVRHRMSRSVIDLKVELAHDHYILVRQYETMKLGTVFSFFGGQLGLFLGCSILTIVHTILFCGQAMVERFAVHFKRRRAETWPKESAPGWMRGSQQSGYTAYYDHSDQAPPPYHTESPRRPSPALMPRQYFANNYE